MIVTKAGRRMFPTFQVIFRDDEYRTVIIHVVEFTLLTCFYTGRNMKSQDNYLGITKQK